MVIEKEHYGESYNYRPLLSLCLIVNMCELRGGREGVRERVREGVREGVITSYFDMRQMRFLVVGVWRYDCFNTLSSHRPPLTPFCITRTSLLGSDKAAVCVCVCVCGD